MTDVADPVPDLAETPVDVWRADDHGRLVVDLPRWRRHTGQTPDEVLGDGWLRAVDADHRAAVASDWERAVATRVPFECAFPIRGRDGGVRAVLLRATPTPTNPDGAGWGWEGTVLDVTDSLEASDPQLEARTAETLREIGARLVADLDVERVVQQVTDTATELIGAQFGSFFYNVVGDTGESYLLYTLSGAARESFAGFPMPRNTPVFEPTFRGDGVIRLDDVTADPRYGQNPPYHGMPPGHLPVRSYLAVPVTSRHGEVLGGLFFGHATAGVFTSQHERLVVGIASQATIAIENARLYQTAQKEREAAQRLAERLAHLQVVSSRLAGAKDLDEVADVVVAGGSQALRSARACLYVLDQEGETLRLVRSSGTDPATVARWLHLDRGALLPASEALRSRALVTISDRREWRERYPAVGPHGAQSAALAVIPLALGQQVFGVATFGWDSPRQFSDDDRQFLDALADQCSQALERARLYEFERETVRTLQRSLLPPRTPEISGMEVGAIYRAGDRSVAVGGDFYDVFRLGPNRWGLTMGDVCGRGALAASRTALARYTLRALAGRGDSPSDALRGLNSTVLAEPEADDRFCAAVVGLLELDRCGAWITVACAGHPRPVVVRRAGWVDVRGQPGTLIGVLDELEVTDDRVGLGPGDSLVFFTDGICEARNSRGEQFDDEALSDTLLDSTQLDAPALAERLRKAAVDFSGGTLGDDLAILVVRVPPDAVTDPDQRMREAIGDEGPAPGYPVPHGGRTGRVRPPREARMHLPAEPSSASRARRFLTGVLASWRMDDMNDGEAELLLSELATNAIVHARSAFTVMVRYNDDRLRVEVGDGSWGEPRQQVRDPEGAGGLGLVLIGQLAASWGVLPTAQGKRVWFELPVPPISD